MGFAFTFQIFGMAMVMGGLFPWKAGFRFTFQIVGMEPGGVFSAFAMETGGAFTF